VAREGKEQKPSTGMEVEDSKADKGFFVGFSKRGGRRTGYVIILGLRAGITMGEQESNSLESGKKSVPTGLKMSFVKFQYFTKKLSPRGKKKSNRSRAAGGGGRGEEKLTQGEESRGGG